MDLESGQLPCKDMEPGYNSRIHETGLKMRDGIKIEEAIIEVVKNVI
jgi:hypothetical protein